MAAKTGKQGSVATGADKATKGGNPKTHKSGGKSMTGLQ